jgi:hypothetical protein
VQAHATADGRVNHFHQRRLPQRPRLGSVAGSRRLGKSQSSVQTGGRCPHWPKASNNPAAFTRASQSRVARPRTRDPWACP